MTIRTKEERMVNSAVRAIEKAGDAARASALALSRVEAELAAARKALQAVGRTWLIGLPRGYGIGNVPPGIWSTLDVKRVAARRDDVDPAAVPEGADPLGWLVEVRIRGGSTIDAAALELALLARLLDRPVAADFNYTALELEPGDGDPSELADAAVLAWIERDRERREEEARKEAAGAEAVSP